MKVRAEWHGGRLLREIEREPGGRPVENSVQPGPSFSSYQSALREAGLSDSTAKRWQLMAMVSEEDLEGYFAYQRGHGHEITTADVYRRGQQTASDERIGYAERTGRPGPRHHCGVGRVGRDAEATYALFVVSVESFRRTSSTKLDAIRSSP